MNGPFHHSFETPRTFRLRSEPENVTTQTLPAAKRRWWLRSRPCRLGIQLNAGDGMPPCQEFFVPWWAWPFELCQRLLFPSLPLLHVPFPDYPEIELHARKIAIVQEGGVWRRADRDELTALRDALKEANGICRSMHAIAWREGGETNWPAFRGELTAVLRKQHALRLDLNLYP